MMELESEVERANFEIENEMDGLRKILEDRERDMKSRVEGAAAKKKDVLLAQLTALTREARGDIYGP